MTRSLIAVAALVASVSVSAGELDGKGLICKPDEESTPFGFEFSDGRAIGWSVERHEFESKAVIEEFGSGKEYRTTPTRAFWWEIGHQEVYQLDRKTLRLRWVPGAMELEAKEYQCEVAASLDSFRATLEDARAEMQLYIDFLMKDNQI